MISTAGVNNTARIEAKVRNTQSSVYEKQNAIVLASFLTAFNFQLFLQM